MRRGHCARDEYDTRVASFVLCPTKQLTHTDYRDRLYHEISKRKKEARRREQQRQRENEEGGELVAADGGDGGDAPAECPPGDA